ncbi:ribosome recycling factor [Salibacterium salarium]|nr:ribosome recycling factor [Salibacterium salarium]
MRKSKEISEDERELMLHMLQRVADNAVDYIHSTE